MLSILRADLAPVAAVVNVAIGARARDAAGPLTARNCRIAAAAFHLVVQAHAAHNAADLQAAADIWNNRMNRYVRRGAKGIALLDESSGFPRLHYVFDVSDTGVRRNSRDPKA